MSDLFSPLRDSTEPLPTSPDDIRRRGDRARRRRTALQGGVALAAAAAVASGVLLLTPEPARQIQPAPPSPTPSPTEVEAPTMIPADFPLEAGLIEGGKVTEAPWLADIQYCGDASASLADTGVDAASLLSKQPMITQARSLELFDSADEARARAEGHVGKFEACPRSTLDSGASYASTRVSDSGIGDQGWTVRRTFTSGGEPQFGQQIYQLVRSGNALLITGTYAEGPGSTDLKAFERAVRTDTRSIHDVVRAMCAWSEEGCVGG